MDTPSSTPMPTQPAPMFIKPLYEQPMHGVIKNILGVAIIIVLIVLAGAGVMGVMAYSSSTQPGHDMPRTFSVKGTGKAVGIPDVASFNYSITTDGGKDFTALQKDNIDKANKVKQFLRSSGVEEKDINTLTYSIDPRMQYYNCDAQTKVCPPAEVVGYTMTQSIAVKVRNMAKVGDILTGVVQNGANGVSSLSFVIDDTSALEAQARGEAINKAKQKALDVARSANVKLGRIMSVDEYTDSPGPVYYASAPKGADMGGGAVPTPDIQAGSQQVNISVTINYEMQ